MEKIGVGGLLEQDLALIREALEKFPEIESAILFGSRALGNYKKGSDVDLAIVGKEITHQIISELNDWLNEIYPLPYMFDLLHYNAVSNENLRRHIDQYGTPIYVKTTTAPSNHTCSASILKRQSYRTCFPPG